MGRFFFPLLSDPLDLGIDDDQHDYDSVASDEDTDSELTTQNNNNTQRSNRAKVYSVTHFFLLLNSYPLPHICVAFILVNHHFDVFPFPLSLNFIQSY